ncbi:MAG: hypothetical protein EAZ29_03550, partial [Runella slithyformis]
MATGKKYLLLMAFVVLMPTQAQCFFLADSLVAKDTTKIRRSKLTYAINWDARSSFIDRKFVNIWGINTGVQFGKNRHEITFGY